MLILLVVALAIFAAFSVTRKQSGERPITAEEHDPVEGARAGRAFSSAPVVGADSSTEAARAEECHAGRAPLDHEQYVAEREAHIRQVMATLSDSRNAEHLLSVALLSQMESENVDRALLDKATAVDPDNPLIAWNQLLLCMEAGGVNCDLQGVSANAISADGDNGMVWLQIAALRLRQDNQVAAIRAARRAVASPGFDDYFIDTVLLIERALASVGDSSFQDRIIVGMGLAAATSASYDGILEHCGEIVASDGVWVELCDQVGARMFSEGSSLAVNALGASLQKTAAAHTGDERLIAEAAARYASFQQHYRQFTMSVGKNNALLENDERVLRRYVEDFAIFGELEALIRLDAEAKRLRNSPDYDQCNFVPRGY